MFLTLHSADADDAVTEPDRRDRGRARRKSEEKRAAALWRITDLFIAGAENFADDHVSLFDDVMERLAATIEKNARAKLSSRLARVANAPLGVIRDLARDHDIRVAQPVLRHSPRLDSAI